MISLAIFTSKNSFPTYIATLESFFDKCEDLFLINEIILVDDRVFYPPRQIMCSKIHLA